MTVEQMIAQRTAELTAIKAASNAVVAAKGGTPADNLSGMPAAIESIPSGGDLPELTTPAEVGHVVAGKEYIDASGAKKTGTLVVCDSVKEVETVGVPGVGLSVYIESPADGSAGELTLQEPNLLAENIKSGVSIFGVHGTAKTMRVETGTITPAEDITEITIPAPFDGCRAIVLTASDASDLEAKGADSIYCFRAIIAIDNGVGNTGIVIRYNGSGYVASTKAPIAAENGNIYISGNTGRYYRAGIVYNYYVYYWEDAE